MQLRIHGRRDDVETLPPPVGSGFESVVRTTVTQAYRLETVRGAADPILTEPLGDQDVVEIELEDGLRLWVRADELDSTLGSIRRGAGGPESGVIDVPPTLRPRSAERGVASWIIRALRVLKVDPLKKGAEGSALWVAGKLEAKLIPKPGLHLLNRDGALEPMSDTRPSGQDRILLFLHGTASNTNGSFGALLEPERAARWASLQAAYQGRVYALEHRTLSVSPLQNAIEALQDLPDGATLHLVSHSRGGLIGELLCRGHLMQRDEPFSKDEIDLFWDGGQADLAAELGRLIAAKRPRVERFVRVACPARGTTLADERLDRWLSVLTNLVGLIPRLSGDPLYDFVKSFLLAVVRERANPRTIPGLEAMIPDSPFQKLINRPLVVADADLSVIKGDLEGGTLLQRLGTLATDLFFREDHDLVVNTSAMDGGTRRREGARVFFDQGPNVSHFHYFTNEATVERLMSGLLRRPDDQAGFAPLVSREVKSLPRTVVTKRGGVQPTVFVLPGIMGSTLSAHRQRIWIDLPRLALGGLRQLEIADTGVEADGVVAEYYQELIDHLSETHKVVPFPYDWRLPIADEAARFARALQEHLATPGPPVRIVAHSMGGLVARAAFAQGPGVWQSFRAREGARLVMLGVPNGGSHSIPMMLMGRDQTMHMLAALDFTMNRREHLEIASRLPGVLDLLPEDPDLDLFAESGWSDLKDHDAEARNWIVPDPAALARARAFRQTLQGAPFDPRVMVYVAGRNVTVDGIRIDRAANRVEFRRTHEGDGRVPWRTGILPGMPVWYANAAHGDLARHRPAFAAIADLLEHGTTNRLPDKPDAVRGDVAPPPDIERERLEVYPDEQDLAAAALGGRIARPDHEAPRSKPVRIEVRHGNLAFARFPLAVGHYRGDTLAGAEAHLDRMLDGRLSRWRELGLYPGEIGTTEVILDVDRAEGAAPRGAIVVGLGDAGRLTPGDLERALIGGLLRYAAVMMDGRRGAAMPLKVSTLLVGSGAGGLPVPGCVTALLRALRRAQAVLGGCAFEEVEILELYEDRAIQIWHEVKRIGDGPGLAGSFRLAPDVAAGEGGRRRVAEADDRTWWQPMTVTMTKVNGKEVMNFIVSSGKARAEATLQPTNKAFVDRFIQQAMAANATDRGLGTPGRTLFEMLVPDYLKEEAREDRSLRLVLDPPCAAYPWELLDDRRRWLEEPGPQGGDERPPPAVRNGLIRQLIRQNFRERVTRPRGPGKALVIGDPRRDAAGWMPPLDGAVAEAEAVADLLTRRGLTVERLIRDCTADEVVMALCAQDWQVVHIAAHGIADTIDGTESGIVLGKDLILTADMIGQLLPMVPDLVFVNCCHIGDMSTVAELEKRQGLTARRNVIASNVAVKLIEIGVSAVVAAGWAVDDEAARLFAETFYQELFDPDRSGSLGEAARVARALTYGQHPHTTTWGAYHVYGEPDWRPAANGLGRKAANPAFASIAEAINAVDRIRQDAQTGMVRDATAQQKRLDDILAEAGRRGWSGDPLFLSGLAAAYGELGLLDEAITFYEKALRSEPAATPVRGIEQLVNLTVRRAVRDARLGRTTGDHAAVVRTMVKRLDDLQGAIDPQTNTSERLSLRGACCKRLAQIVSGPERDEALAEMAVWYGRASDLERAASGACAPYPTLMRIAAQTVIMLRDPTRGQPPEVLAAALDEAERAAKERDRKSPQFWHGVARGDALLLRHLLGQKIMPADAEAIADAYLSVWRRGGSRLKLNSVIEQLEFVIDVLKDPAPPQAGACGDLRKALAGIRDALERKTRTPP